MCLLRRYAASNTRRGVESCGILAGVLDEKNACFQICTLIIPKQEGTSDTVQVSPAPCRPLSPASLCFSRPVVKQSYISHAFLALP